MARSDGLPSRPRPAHPIASVDNALRLLRMFGDAERIRISDASRALGVVPSTASRLMAMLQYHGLVVQDPDTKAYRAGPVLVNLGLNVVRRMDGRRQVRPYLEQLAREVDETVHFCVLDDEQVIFVDGIESSRPVKTTLRIGMRRHAHCVSAGKALLAALPADRLHEIYPKPRLPTCTEHSIATRAALERELEGIRRRGYATSIRESEPDIAAIAMTIEGAHRAALGALSISLPVTRYTKRSLDALADPLQRTVAAASREIAQMETVTH
jgi:DNA-binding IclR family transcriptional regulator